MTGAVQGEARARGTTAGRRWAVAEMLAHVSRGEGVHATDVARSGTFGAGCGLDSDRWLAP